MFRSVCLVGIAVLLAQGLCAQVRTLAGSVTDAADGGPIPGVLIKVDGTAIGAIADDNGHFRLADVPAGPLTLRAVAMGFQETVVGFDPAKDRPDAIKVRMAPASHELPEAEVVGRAEGQLRAMLDQKRAENIKNVVSAEQIATFPDMNAAEVMQRIPGITLQRDQGEGRFVQLRGTPPELTTFNINGEQVPSPQGGVRYVGMDIIPADQIELIEVNKVMTPDMDADGIGGSVNIKTKEAASDKPDIRATLAGGYSDLRQKPNYQLQYTYGQRYGKFGFNLNTSFFRNQQGTDNIEFDMAKGPFRGSTGDGVDNYHVQLREVQLRYYDITRTRISVAPTFDYRFGKNSVVYLRAMYNRFTDDELRYRKIYELDDAVSYSYYLYSGVVHDVRAREKRQQLATLSLGGEHRLGKMTMDYQVFAALAQEDEPDRMEASFTNPGPGNMPVRFNFDDPDFPRAEFPNAQHAAYAVDYDHYTLNGLLFEERSVKDVNWTPRINLSIPYSLNAGNTGYIKFGGKIRAKNKARDIAAQQYAAYRELPLGYPANAGPPLSLATVNDGFHTDDLLGAGYVLDHMPAPGPMRDFHEFYPHHFVYDRNGTKVQSIGEDYEAQERIHAVYGMVRHDLRRLMLIAGLRYERTDIAYTGAKVLTDGTAFLGIEPLEDRRSHAFWLPQVQAKYAVNEDFNLRAALTYTYSRPNFDDVLPYREQDREEVKYGNPDLRYPRSTNLDLLAERYFGKGILSGGLFHKRIDDFIFFFKRFAHEGDPGDYGLVEITKAVNGDQAQVYGAELQYQSKFTRLPGKLGNLGAYANYTYTHSEAVIDQRQPANYTDAVVIFGEDNAELGTTDGRKEHLPLPGQATHTANLALFYDASRFFVRITANYHDAFLYQLGADKDLDVHYDQEFRLDLTANYEVSKHLKVFVDLINITDTPLRYYLGTPDRVQQLEYYSWWGRMGIKLDF